MGTGLAPFRFRAGFATIRRKRAAAGLSTMDAPEAAG
jgi:hypothetical protein